MLRSGLLKTQSSKITANERSGAYVTIQRAAPRNVVKMSGFLLQLQPKLSYKVDTTKSTQGAKQPKRRLPFASINQNSVTKSIMNSTLLKKQVLKAKSNPTAEPSAQEDPSSGLHLQYLLLFLTPLAQMTASLF